MRQQLPKNVLEWTASQVELCDFEPYIRVFREKGIDGNKLLSLSMKELEAFGVSSKLSLKLYSGISELRNECRTTEQTPPSHQASTKKGSLVSGATQRSIESDLEDDDVYIQNDDGDDDDDPFTIQNVEKRLRPTSGRHRPQSARRPTSAPPACSERRKQEGNATTVHNSNVNNNHNSNSSNLMNSPVRSWSPRTRSVGPRPKSAMASTQRERRSVGRSWNTPRWHTGVFNNMTNNSNSNAITSAGGNNNSSNNNSLGNTGGPSSSNANMNGMGNMTTGDRGTDGVSAVSATTSRHTVTRIGESSKPISLAQCVSKGLIQGETRLVFDIEFCTGCASHCMTTRHDPNKYQSYAENVRDLIKRQVPGCEVTLNQQSWQPRLGAFEICCEWMHGGARYQLPIYSKIYTKKFPNPTQFISRVIAALPKRRSVTCIVRDGGSGRSTMGCQVYVRRPDESRVLLSSSETDSRGSAVFLLCDGRYVVQAELQGYIPSQCFLNVSHLTAAICLPLYPPTPAAILRIVLSWSEVPTNLQLKVVCSNGQILDGEQLNQKYQSSNEHDASMQGFGPQAVTITRPFADHVRVFVLHSRKSETNVSLKDSNAKVVLLGHLGILAEFHVPDSYASKGDHNGDCEYWDAFGFEDDGQRVAVASINQLNAASEQQWLEVVKANGQHDDNQVNNNKNKGVQQQHIVENFREEVFDDTNESSDIDEDMLISDDDEHV